MRINIPKKLSKHKDYIKEKSEVFVHAKNLSMFKVAESQGNGQYKEVYLIYNPFATSIKLDINHFKSEKDVYKMYPSTISVPAREVYAFIVFSSQPISLDLDVEYLLFRKKQEISASLKNLSNRFIGEELHVIVEEFDVDVNSTMLLDDYIPADQKLVNLEVEKTQDLKRLQNEIRKLRQEKYGDDLNAGEDTVEPEEMSYDRVVAEKSELESTLKGFTYLKNEDRYKLVVQFTNRSLTTNYEIKGFTVALLDKDHKQEFLVEDTVRIKKASRKKAVLFLDGEYVETLNMKDLKVKIIL